MRNIVVILCDQLRPDFLKMYGCDAVPTPNLDKLAARGVVFDNAITQSTVCAPARATMMTGRYVSDHGVWTNDRPFRQGMELIAPRMNENGYRTGAFGKLHHFPADDPKGFEVSKMMEEGRLGDGEPFLQWLREKHPEAKGVWNHRDYQWRYAMEDYYEYWIASEAISFIEDTTDGGEKPFLAWISFQGPHGPIDPPREVKGTVDSLKLPVPVRRVPDEEKQLPETVAYRKAREPQQGEGDEVMAKRTAYAEQIVAIDLQIGRVVDRIETLGVLDSTTFIFSADHGDMLGDFGMNAKGPFPYPGQMDIPLMLAHHPDVAAGSRSPHLAGNIDIPGTLLAIAEDRRPIGYSRSLIDLARSEPEFPREVNYSEFCDSMKVVEDAQYRYAYYPFEDVAELYDKENDPHFLRNLSGSQAVAEVERKFLRDVIDFQILAKGVRVEAHDFVPASQEALRRKDPAYQDRFPVVFPLTRQAIDRLTEAGLDSQYNEFCRTREVIRYYETPYWMEN